MHDVELLDGDLPGAGVEGRPGHLLRETPVEGPGRERRPAGRVEDLENLAAVTEKELGPADIIMRAGAQWVLSHEGLDENTPGWVDVGFLVSDAGILVLLLLTLLAWLGLRRPRAGPWLAGLGSLYLVALCVAVFAMSAKP